MDFESMRVIWDAQNQAPLFAFDRDAINAKIKRKAQQVKSSVLVFDTCVILATLGASIVLAWNAIFDGELHDLPLAAIMLGVFGYVVMGMVTRKRHESGIEQTVMGDLNWSILKLDYQIRRQREMVWWYIVPFLIGMLVVLPAHIQGKPPWFWVFTLAVFAFMHWRSRAEIRTKLEPRKAGLEALRDMLAEGEEIGMRATPGNSM